MIDEHIIFVESKGNVFNDATFFNTNACSCNGDVLMNLNVLDAWYNGIDNTIYAHLLSIKKSISHLSNASMCFNFVFIITNNYIF